MKITALSALLIYGAWPTTKRVYFSVSTMAEKQNKKNYDRALSHSFLH